jgi:hypothetical protein
MSNTPQRSLSGAHQLDPLALLLRGFAVDFLTSHDPAEVEWIMAEDYCLHIGGHTFSGRDREYLPATAAQLEQFPGLCVTVHDVVLGENAVAMQFTEHGVSCQHGGRNATWRGITFFYTDGERLQTGWAEEDYFSRKSQLASGVCESVDAPHPAPWDQPRKAADAAVEKVARSWLSTPQKLADLPSVHWLSALGPRPEEIIDISHTHIDSLFSAGDRVAFHLQYEGTYLGGFEGIDAAMVGTPIVLRAAGLLTVSAGQVVAARITTDRLGLLRALQYAPQA